MKFFIDTADVNEIRQAAAMGIIDGVTTNPSLIAKTGRVFADVIKEIVTIVDGPISAEVISMDAPGMIKEGRELAKIHPNIVIKVPMCVEGLKATKAFTAEGIKTNVTLIFSASQALLAAKAGATYVSPFVGRVDDVSGDGMALVEDIALIYDNYDIATEIIVASVRHPLHFVEAARIGAHVATIPFATLAQLLNHPLTASGMARFLQDWEKVKR